MLSSRGPRGLRKRSQLLYPLSSVMLSLIHPCKSLACNAFLRETAHGVVHCMLYPAYQANQGQQPFATATLPVICRAVACPVVQNPRAHSQPQQENQQHACTCQLDVAELYSAAVALLQAEAPTVKFYQHGCKSENCLEDVMQGSCTKQYLLGASPGDA